MGILSVFTCMGIFFVYEWQHLNTLSNLIDCWKQNYICHAAEKIRSECRGDAGMQK